LPRLASRKAGVSMSPGCCGDPPWNCLIWPWVGENYRALPERRRLFVLGESMYRPETESGPYDPGTLIWLIRATLCGEWRPRRNFYQRVHYVLTGQPWCNMAGADRQAFWDRIAFYNYVQWPVPGGPGCRPDERMWTESGQHFQEVFSRLTPGGVVVLGHELWCRLCAAGFGLICEPGVCQVAAAGHQCRAVFVYTRRGMVWHFPTDR